MVELNKAGDPYQHGFPNSVLIVAGTLFVTFAAFFGYKLYRSLTARERRRQEKLLAKQSKSQKKKN